MGMSVRTSRLVESQRNDSNSDLGTMVGVDFRGNGDQCVLFSICVEGIVFVGHQAFEWNRYKTGNF